ncbi:hypothetical protein RI054_17g80400 [Pseudoscourfieldia marina]
MAGSRRVARSRRLADRCLADIDKDISPGTRVKKRFSTDAGMEWYHGRVTSVREADAYPICVTYDDGEKESYDRAEFHRDVVVCRDAVTPPRVPPASDEHDKRRRRDDDTPNSARASTGRRRPRKRQSRPSATAAQGRRLAIDFEEHARSHSEDTCPPAFTTTASATTTTETQITTTETRPPSRRRRRGPRVQPARDAADGGRRNSMLTRMTPSPRCSCGARRIAFKLDVAPAWRVRTARTRSRSTTACASFAPETARVCSTTFADTGAKLVPV